MIYLNFMFAHPYHYSQLASSLFAIRVAAMVLAVTSGVHVHEPYERYEIFQSSDK